MRVSVGLNPQFGNTLKICKQKVHNYCFKIVRFLFTYLQCATKLWIQTRGNTQNMALFGKSQPKTTKRWIIIPVVHFKLPYITLRKLGPILSLYIYFRIDIRAPKSPYITFKSNIWASKSPYITFKSNIRAQKWTQIGST